MKSFFFIKKCNSVLPLDFEYNPNVILNKKKLYLLKFFNTLDPKIYYKTLKGVIKLI